MRTAIQTLRQAIARRLNLTGVFRGDLPRNPPDFRPDAVRLAAIESPLAVDATAWRSPLMVRRDNRMESFQRQISALRQQLGSDQEDDEPFDDAEPMSEESNATPVYTSPARSSPRDIRGTSQDSWQNADTDVGVIAANSTWSGTLRSNGSVHVLGTAEGDINARHEIHIADSAQVTATLRAETITVAGVVDGVIECSGRLEVLATGRVSGDVTTPSLVVHDGATVTGKLRMEQPRQLDEQEIDAG
jgi:cytoskeletal protein CcmA (bactofilin family)